MCMFSAYGFNLLNNIHFMSPDINLTSIVPNIKEDRVILLDPEFPYLDIYPNGTYTPVYEGIPQRINYTDLRNRTLELFNNTNNTHNLNMSSYNGYIVLDFEQWRPNWDSLNDVYKNESMTYIYDLYPNKTMNYSMAEQLAKKSWEYYSLDIMLNTIDTCREVAPFSKIGYYGFPHVSQVGQSPEYKKNNDMLVDLWKEVDVFLPSLYLTYNSSTNVNHYIYNKIITYKRIKEAYRLQQQMNTYGYTDKEIYAYTWYRYHESPHDLFEYSDFILEYMYPSTFHEVDGLILWGNECDPDDDEDTISWFAEYSCMLEQL